MHLVLSGMNFKTAPIHLREKFSLLKSEIPDVLKLLKTDESILECVLLSTCNRVELYAMFQNEEPKTITNFFNDHFDFTSDMHALLYTKQDSDAVKHLCEVASGLDSMILGEPEIFGQVKESYRIAGDCGSIGNYFRVLFPQVFSVAKIVRSKTGISDHNLSVSYAAVRLIENSLSNLSGKSALLVGAGKIGAQTVRNLRNIGVQDIYIANRTFMKAVNLSEEIQGTPIMLYEIKEYLPEVDILVSSITVPHRILEFKEIKLFEEFRIKKPLLLIDLSVPRSIDPKVNELDFIKLFNIDDLRNVINDNLKLRQKESQKGRKIIDEKAEAIFDKINAQDIVPTVLNIKKRAEEIRQQSLTAVMKDLNIPQNQKEKIELVTKSIIDDIVEHTMIKLKEYTRNSKS